MHRPYDDHPDARIRRAWATVHTRGATGAGLGAGVVVADGFLLTCAHVVNAALGRPKLTVTQPTEQDMLQVAVSFPSLGTKHHAVELASWMAPRPEGEQWWDGDLALLKAELGTLDIRPVPVRETSSPWLSTWYANGAPRSLVDVYRQASMGPWYILDPGRARLEIQPGHSGAPLWDRDHGCVTGLVVSTEPDNPRSYAIRASEMVKLLATAGVFPAMDTEVSDPRTRARRGELIHALEELCDADLKKCAARLGRALGQCWTPATCSELVDAAMRHPRGMPALLSTLAEHGAVARRVQDLAAKLGSLRFFTQDEYDELCALLGPNAHPEVRAAARRAVPHFSLTEAEPPAVGALIEDLEDRASDPGVVPPVIQVIEEVAAARREDGDALREWSQRVTERLGVSAEAVRQCRWSAKSRAAARTSQPVLRVWLWAASPTAEAFHYVIRLYDAHGHQVRTWTDGDTLRSRADLCADLSDAVEDLDQYEESAGVEFLLEEGCFGLAVDRLPTHAGPVGTRPIGLDRLVVLRGQSVWRSGLWKTRWEHGQSSAAAPYVLHDQQAADHILTSRSDIACVIASCPPDQHNEALALCRWQGVPVVLWHRSAHGPDTTAKLRDVIPQNWPHRLREEVRLRRAEALHDTTHLGADLALLWEDPSWAPPRPRLTNPTRREGGAA
ncbi:trypsin-like peptidase domain-containing protein [Streptomyces sp. AC555_RSS877]|uniref:VMAP-C domain-containing protein n=1 Tax=Streptomyces sp. AC555_RSS877 TaxID=2823688 RepID=UPI001C26D903|nr:trypsin-like peptidase domain-containing protein [Streptomyces sp. AC555_RSS877]